MPREPLPPRRFSDNIQVISNGTFMTMTVGRYPDGRPGEVFVSDIKAGTAADALLRDTAILMSLALQYGCPIETMQHAITRDAVGGSSSFMGSLIDELAKEKE